MELDMRKMRILQAIIDDYILTATPVGSRTVSKKSDIALSSATIRNVMSDLEEMGYLEQPHTSAGRIPSEKAYRLYVNSIMHRAMLTESEQRFIQNCYSNTINKVDEIVRQTAWVLSNMTKYTSLVLSPNINAVKLKHIQLVPVTEGMRVKAAEVTATLRASGVSADMDIMGRKMAKALKFASSARARYAVIVGEKEMEQDSVTLRDMSTGEQTLVKVAELCGKIRI